MTIRLAQLDETNRPAFEALLAEAWRQNWDSELERALIRWRYDDRPSGGGTWLALHDDRCVAMLDSFVRPYLLDGRRILVREGCDWYCLPKYRPLGLGIKLVRALMARDEPTIVIGGSDTTVEMLPRLGWKRLPDVQKYVLPIKARGLTGALLRNRWPDSEAYARVIPDFIHLRRPKRALAPPNGVGRVVEWRQGTVAVPPPKRQGLVELLEQVDQDWIAQIPPDVAEPLGLAFFLDGEPVGVSLSQIEQAVAGCEGCIVHLQIARPDQATADWVVAETAHRLAARGVGIIRCLASTAEKTAALRRAGFAAREALPCYWWSKPEMPTPSELDAGYLRADDAIPFTSLHERYAAGPWRAGSSLSHISRAGSGEKHG